jgi:hypothetical protein
MLANVRLIGRDYCLTPSHAETVAGCLTRPPKSPVRATFAPRCASTGRAKEGRQVRRDDSLEIIMDGPRKTPRPGRALGDWQTRKDHANKYAKPASKLIEEAGAIAASIPYTMTRERKRSAVSRFLDLWLQALAASRDGVV